jgi:hypothetical protein
MADKKTDRQKLRMWQERLSKNQAAFDGEVAKMDAREELYRGSDALRAMVRGDRKEKTPHVRNICAELIEAQVDSNIPQPKVTACREKDEHLAKLIEDMLRNEMDALPFEEINDIMERTVPIQGGAAFLVEWDNTKRTHYTVGELSITQLHPKQLVPQDGVYTSVEDMDYIILKIPQTKEYIKRRYNVDVEDETEQEPDVKGALETSADDLVTQYIAYYRNDKGGIGLYSWVNNTQLEDLDDYQARRLRRCASCGAVEPLNPEPTKAPVPIMPGITGAPGMPDLTGLPSGTGPSEMLQPPEAIAIVIPETAGNGEKICPQCGSSEWTDSAEDHEELFMPIKRSDGSVIPGAIMPGVPTRIPFYKPDIYPVVLQKNVSLFGQLLGDSDLDKIADQQNTINRIEAKIIDKLLMSGSYITLPDEASIKVDADDMKVIRPGNAATKNLIDVYDLQGNVEQDLTYLRQTYEESRQIIGVTDSFQGRQDRTATSGKAKEFAAAQTAGRLESKRVMKHAAYAKLFEAMFKFKLAYADEPRPVVSMDIHGKRKYDTFNRYDFLEQDAAGEWCWNDRFLFSCDTTAPLASNREAMWQETRMNLQTGAFGDPTNPATLILFWSKMEMLHYPGAGETRAYIEEETRKQQQMQMRQMQMLQAQQQAQVAMTEGPEMQEKQRTVEHRRESRQLPPELAAQIERAARQQAMKDAGVGGQ